MANDNPPVQDSNFNSKLDGYDLVKAMEAEEKEGSRRTAAERVHGILDIVEARNLAIIYTKFELEGAERTSLNVQAAQLLNESLTGSIAAYKRDPQKFEADLRKNLPAVYRGREDLLKADLESFKAFVGTFDQKFKGGVDIKPEEINGVLGHFKPPVFIVPRPAPQPGTRPPGGREA